MIGAMSIHEGRKLAGKVKCAAVIGSGVMGAGIAAQLANAGFEVMLLDQLPTDLTAKEQQAGLTLSDPAVRNRMAQSAKNNLLKAKPAALYIPGFASRIAAGNLKDGETKIAKADWIIEAVTERLDVKRQVFAWIDKWRRPGSLVSTNTSGLSAMQIIEGSSEDLQRHFAVTHFFNPPRYMKLVEIIPGANTRQAALTAFELLCAQRLGKGTVRAKDTPNFIANRIGAHGMLVTLALTEQLGLSIEEADALSGPAMGRPKTATYRMLDMIGLDTLLHVIDNVRERSSDMEEKEIFQRPAVLEKLVAAGKLGAKSGEGFYRKQRGNSGESIIEALRPLSMNYEQQAKVKSPVADAAKQAKGTAAKVRALLLTAPSHPHARFAWLSLKATWLYTAHHAYQIAETIEDIDKAMKWGFNWELGPFELWDAIGFRYVAERMREEGERLPDWIEAMLESGKEGFYSKEQEKRFYIHQGSYTAIEQEDDVISLQQLKESGKTVWASADASLIDMGDEVVCLEFHSANNAIGSNILAALRRAADDTEQGWRGLVLANEGRNFCVGANLVLLLMEAQNGDWEEVEDIIRYFQSSMQRLKKMARPLVAAPHRMALGGGVEVCLPADRIIFSPETYFGLVETGVGLIPAGGGSKEAARLAAARAEENKDAVTGLYIQPHLNRLFETIALGKASTSGHEALALGLARSDDQVIMRQECRIAEAKRAVLELDRAGYMPATEQPIHVVGREGRAVLQTAVQAMRLGGHISNYDAHVAGKLAYVLSGGDVQSHLAVSEQYLLDLECEAFLSLCGESKTQQRMQHMLTSGKPLRN